MRVVGSDVETKAPQRHAQPIAIEILDVKGMGQQAILDKVRAFFAQWEATHVLSAPQYIMGNNGEERLILQATCKQRWYEQNELQGIASARAQIAGGEEIQGYQSGAIRRATPGMVPGPGGAGAPRPGGRGVFPGGGA